MPGTSAALAALCAAALLAAPGAARGAQKTVSFVTADGCSIAAFYSAPSSGAYVFVNTHGLGSTKEEWAVFQDTLRKSGRGWLSLDLRGHGGSLKCGGKAVYYRAFSPADWNTASLDIEAAAKFLLKKGVPGKRQVFCGASVGANLSAKAAAEGTVKPAALVLLSPGLEYAGVRAYEYIAAAGLPALLAASADDKYADGSAQYMAAKAAGAGLKADYFPGPGGHGVNMFGKPGLAERIAGWPPPPAR